MLFDGFDFAPPGDLLSLLVDRHPVQRKLGKETPPGIRVFAPVPLRRLAVKDHPWPEAAPPIGAFSASCLETCCATPALCLLTGMVRLPKPLCRVENAACGFSTGRILVDNAARLSTLRITPNHARTNSPVRRVSVIGVEGVERHGCRESHDGPWMALRDVPLEHRWSERTPSAKRSGPDVGCVSSWLLLLAA